MPRALIHCAVGGALLAAFVAGSSSVRGATGQSSPAALRALKSVSVDLPNGDRVFPDGPGVDAISRNCLECHSAGMVLNQPALPETAWAGIVRKMVAVYKAPVTDEDAAAIVAYLVRIKGAK